MELAKEKSSSSPKVDFPVGSHVLVKFEDTEGPTKLSPSWRGPFKVKKFSAPFLIVESLIDGLEDEFHQSWVKAYDETRTNDFLTIAALDKDEYEIEKILEHQPKELGFKARDKKKTLQFLVKWKGLPAEHNEWLTYMNVRDTAALQQYVSEHKMKI